MPPVTAGDSVVPRERGPGHAVRRLLDGNADLLGLAAAAIVVLLMAAIVVDVVWAGLGGAGVKGLVEYGEVAVVGIVFLSIAQAQKAGSHVAVDVLVELLEAEDNQIRIRAAENVIEYAVKLNHNDELEKRIAELEERLKDSQPWQKH